jgi:Trk K+ transport system NAD-binding subunit
MFVLVAGAGRTGAQLAKMLITQGYRFISLITAKRF